MVKYVKRGMIVLLALSLAMGMTACKSQKKIAKQQAKADYTASLEKARKDLKDILNENTTLSLTEQEALVKDIKLKNFKDDEIDALIEQAEDKLTTDRSKMSKPGAETPKQSGEVKAPKEKTITSLGDYFSSIAGAASASEANMFINEALGLFCSPDAPVLIIISKSGEIPDYDRPTTINKYLNYLKDTKNNINRVERITYDENGRIRELELLKMK